MPAELSAEVEVRDSTIAGNGLHAKATIGAGAPVVRFAQPPDSPAGLQHLNHSCDPNLGWGDSVTLLALRAIGAGEELTVDYATAICNPDWALFCHCETYRCRQVIEGTDWQIPQLQQRYAGHWHPAVQRLIDEDR